MITKPLKQRICWKTHSRGPHYCNIISTTIYHHQM